jgi:hypothetical protein
MQTPSRMQAASCPAARVDIIAQLQCWTVTAVGSTDTAGGKGQAPPGPWWARLEPEWRYTATQAGREVAPRRPEINYRTVGKLLDPAWLARRLKEGKKKPPGEE